MSVNLLNLKWKSVTDFNVTFSVYGRDRPVYAAISLCRHNEPKSGRNKLESTYSATLIASHVFMRETAINQFHD